MVFCIFAGLFIVVFFFFKQKTAYEMRISDWSSDVCSSDLSLKLRAGHARGGEDFRGIEPARVGNGHHHRAIRRGPVDSKGGGRESAVRHRPWVAKDRKSVV